MDKAAKPLASGRSHVVTQAREVFRDNLNRLALSQTNERLQFAFGEQSVQINLVFISFVQTVKSVGPDQVFPLTPPKVERPAAAQWRVATT